MFARLTPLILALLAIASTAAACNKVCCTDVYDSDAPVGDYRWDGTGCGALPKSGQCGYTKLCCNTTNGSNGYKCAWV
ncbi:hypothetical protein BDN67DRAFT_968489, partial [Paxillus ammoniavirescens]